MTTDERIATFEARVAVLEAALDFERAERIALQRMLIPPLTEAREGLSMLERNLELSMKHVVERIVEATASGDGDVRAVIEGIYGHMAEMAHLCLEGASKQTLISTGQLAEVMLDGDKVLADRIIALERRFRLLELYLNARFIPEAA